MNKNIDIGGRLHSTATGNIVTGANEVFDDDKNKKQSEINTETYSLVNNINERLNGLSPDQQSALNVATKATNNEAKLGYYVCDTEGNIAAKVISNATGYVLSLGGSIKVKMTNVNTADNVTLNINSTGAKSLYYEGERASANNTWKAGETVEVYYDGTSYYANNVAGGSGSSDGAFDISAKTGQSYINLSAALTAADSILSTSKKKGGMSIKYVQASDNKYVQYRLTADTFSTTESDWQGVDEQPTAGSDNLVKSGGVADKISELEIITNSYNLEINENNTTGYKYFPAKIVKGKVYKVANNSSAICTINLYDADKQVLQQVHKELLPGDSISFVSSYNATYIGGYFSSTDHIISLSTVDSNDKVHSVVGFTDIIINTTNKVGTQKYPAKLFSGNSYVFTNLCSSSISLITYDVNGDMLEKIVDPLKAGASIEYTLTHDCEQVGGYFNTTEQSLSIKSFGLIQDSEVKTKEIELLLTEGGLYEKSINDLLHTSGTMAYDIHLISGYSYMITNLSNQPAMFNSYEDDKTTVKQSLAYINSNSSTIITANADSNYVGAYWNSSQHIFSISSIGAKQRINEISKKGRTTEYSSFSAGQVNINNNFHRFEFSDFIRANINGDFKVIVEKDTTFDFGWKASQTSLQSLVYDTKTAKLAYRNYSQLIDTDYLLVVFYGSGSSKDDNIVRIVHFSTIDYTINKKHISEIPTGYYKGERFDIGSHPFIRKPLFKLSDFGVPSTFEMDAQGFDIFDNRYVFQGSNKSGVSSGISIFDIKEKSYLGDFQINIDDSPIHINNLNYGKKEASAKFPLLYISESVMENRCFVIRVNDDANGYTLVQEISFKGTTHFTNVNHIDWAIDRENNILYAYGAKQTNEGWWTEFAKFNLPDITDSSVNLSDSNILDSWIMYDRYINQGMTIINGKIITASGSPYAMPQALLAIDVIEKRVISELFIESIGEPEGVAILDDKLIVVAAGIDPIYHYYDV